MHFLFFLEGVLRVAVGGGVLCFIFTLRFIFFGRRLVLQLPPPPLALTGGSPGWRGRMEPPASGLTMLRKTYGNSSYAPNA
jgi:hypothetical protein